MMNFEKPDSHGFNKSLSILRVLEADKMECPDLAPSAKEGQDSTDVDGPPFIGPAIYNGRKNTIFLGMQINENNADVILIHEFAHWAVFQVISIGEQWDIIELRCETWPMDELIACWTEKYYLLDLMVGECSQNDRPISLR
jgi:hypothetical protein